MAGLIVLLVPVAFAAIGLIVGFVKGFTKVQTWAGEYVVSALLTIMMGTLLSTSGFGPVVEGITVIVTAVVLLLGCMGLSRLFKRIIRRSMEKRDEQMRKYGFVGALNRLWGGIVLAIKGFTIALLIIAPLFIVLDLAQIEAIRPMLNEVFESGFWIFIKPVVFDFLVIGVINIAIRHGFSNGISSALWALIVLGLAVGAGFMSYNLVFNSGLFGSANEALAGTVASWFGEMQIPEGLPLTIAQWIITAGLFLLLLIVVFIVSFFVSRVLSFARLGSAFYVVDGIIGAIVLLAVFLALLLFVGYIVQPISDLEFMKPLNGYFELSTVAKFFYSENLLINMGVPVLIPLHDWLA